MAPEPRQLAELIGLHLDGALDAAQTSELADRLAADPAARQQFARSVALDTVLPDIAGQLQAPRPVLRLRWWSAAAAAAALVVATGLWLRSDTGGPRLDPGSHALVMRSGSELLAPTDLRRGDVIRAVEGPVTLVWADEGTRVTLQPDSALELVRSGPDKDLVLRIGQVDVEAGTQSGVNHLSVHSGRLTATVVGTRFRVTGSRDGGGSVAVEHGLVAVDDGAQRHTVAAGQALFAGASGPAWVSPVGMDLQAPLAAAPGAQLDVAHWQAERGAGWAGTEHDGALLAKVEATAERVQDPERLAGYAWLLPDLAITADIRLAKPGTLAVILICRRPDGRDWIGNYSVREELPAGRHQRRWSLADLRPEKGAPLAEAMGARVVSVAVCAWHQPVGLVVQSVAVTNSTTVRH